MSNVNEKAIELLTENNAILSRIENLLKDQVSMARKKDRDAERSSERFAGVAAALLGAVLPYLEGSPSAAQGDNVTEFPEGGA